MNDIPWWVTNQYKKNQREQRAREIGIPAIGVPEDTVTIDEEPVQTKLCIIGLIIFLLGMLGIQMWENHQIMEMLCR
jgi:hypothetical protein